jgi:hypothetical protein
MEARLAERGRTLECAAPEELDSLWREAKTAARGCIWSPRVPPRAWGTAGGSRLSVSARRSGPGSVGRRASPRGWGPGPVLGLRKDSGPPCLPGCCQKQSGEGSRELTTG